MKKAKIDVLDIADSFDEKPSEEEKPFPLDMEEPRIDLGEESSLVEQQAPESSSIWRYLTWKTMLLFGIPLIGLILIVSAVTLYLVYDGKKSPSTSAKGMKDARAAAFGLSPVYFENLTALVDDPAGKQRVVAFGIAVVPGRGVNPNLKEGDQDVRIAAAGVVSASLFPELMHDQGRNQIKQKIKASVEGMKGAGTVESVWITSWTIL